MASNNLFAPPTKEEIAQTSMFAPPTKEELVQSKAPDQGIFSKAISEVANRPQESLKEAQAPGYGLGVAKGALGALPVAGGMLGGALGMASPLPGGAIVGSGLGASGGEALKQIGEKYLLAEQPEPIENRVTDILNQGLLGASQEMGSQIIAKPLNIIGDKLGQYYNAIKDKIKPNANEITEAARRLGFEPTKGMLSENQTVQKLEQSLASSPRFTATPQRQALENVKKGFGRASENLENLKTGESDFQLGSKLKSGLENEIRTSKEPVSELYNDINKDLQNIKLQPEINNKSIGMLKKDSVFKTKDGKEFLNQISDDISNLDNVADLKEYRTNLLKNITDSTSELDRLRYEKVYDQITNLRDSSIQALKETDPFVKASGKSGAEVIDELHNKLALADAAHSGNMQQLQKIKGIAGIKGDVKSQGSFLRKLENIPEENLIQKSSSTNVKTLNEFKDKFPSLYEGTKTSQINDLVSRSMDKNGLNVTRFIKNIDKLEPEVKGLLFNEKESQLINDLKLINKETPELLNPSKTGQAIDYKGLLSPTGYLSDISQNILLNRSGALEKASNALKSPTTQTDVKGLLQILGKRFDNKGINGASNYGQ